MTRSILPTLTPQITNHEFSQIHQDALRIIEKIGIYTHCRQAIEKIRDKPGVILHNNRICFAPELISEMVTEYKEYQSRFQPFSPIPEQIILRPYDYASHIVDPNTDNIRPITQRDLIDMTRLVDSLNKAGYPVAGGCPGFAQDMDESLRTINQFRLSVEYSQTGQETDLLTIHETEYIYRMHEVMGWLPLHFNLFLLSPLRVDDASLERIMFFYENGADIKVHISAMPLLGATTPLALRGALAQCAAEILAGYTLMRLLVGEKASNFSIKLFSFDMKYANISLGSAEEALLAIICKEMNDFYLSRGNPNAYIFSMGKLPGQQTAAEKTAQALYKGLAGVRTLTCGGATASTVFSPEQLVFDCEIVAYVNRILKGFQLEEEPYSFESIQESVRENSFLGDNGTVKNYRSVYWTPILFDHSPYQSWREQEPDQRQRVKKLIQNKIDEHNYQLDTDRFQRIEEIFHDAEAALRK